MEAEIRYSRCLVDIQKFNQGQTMYRTSPVDADLAKRLSSLVPRVSFVIDSLAKDNAILSTVLCGFTSLE